MAAQNSIDERGAAARQADDEYRGVARRIATMWRDLDRRSRKYLNDPLDGGHIGRDIVPHMFPAPFGALAQLLKRLLVGADVFVFLGKGIPDLNVAPPIRDASRNHPLEFADVVHVHRLREQVG